MHGSMRVQVRKSTVARPTKARPKVKPNSFSVGLRPAAFFSPLISLSLSLSFISSFPPLIIFVTSSRYRRYFYHFFFRIKSKIEKSELDGGKGSVQKRKSRITSCRDRQFGCKCRDGLMVTNGNVLRDSYVTQR